MEAAVGQLHLGLDTGRSGHATAGSAIRQMTQQRALAYAGFSPQYNHSARAVEHLSEKLAERLTLAPTPDELTGAQLDVSGHA